ncbi:quinone-oxidoreductase qr2 [Quercus suber]|uniref:Quinone-oxidoreductase qr2 n=1 Tax=Quercus suber TaxID=58331 RepID=A0AAW0J6E2_QUESU
MEGVEAKLWQAPFHVPETFSDEVLEKLSGSPNGGAGTYVGDGSKQPSELELDVAFHQEMYFVGISKFQQWHRTTTIVNLDI